LTSDLSTPYSWGGWMIWNYPDVKPSIDGRMHLWEDEKGYSAFAEYYTNVQDWESIDKSRYNNVLPSWFHHIIQKYQLQRLTYSKYCNAVDVCGSLSVFDFAKPFGISQIRENMAEKSRITEKKLSI